MATAVLFTSTVLDFDEDFFDEADRDTPVAAYFRKYDHCVNQKISLGMQKMTQIITQ